MNLNRRCQALAASSAIAALGALATLVTAAPANALNSIPSLSFTCFRGGSTNCTTGNNQFRAKVSSYGPAQVLFEFFNEKVAGWQPSSITQIYFDDTAPSSLLNVAQILNRTGVNFVQPRNVGNLPGGRNINFVADYEISPTSPVQPSGINPGESLGIVFNIRSGFANPFNAVVTDLRNDSLRIGFHAQGFSDGGSESFVNEGVPEPMTMLGTGAAIGLGALMKRRSAQKKAQES